MSPSRDTLRMGLAYPGLTALCPPECFCSFQEQIASAAAEARVRHPQ